MLKNEIQRAETEGVASRIAEDFDYTEKELLKDWQWIQVEEDAGMFGHIFFNGDYVLFADDKVIWW